MEKNKGGKRAKNEFEFVLMQIYKNHSQCVAEK